MLPTPGLSAGSCAAPPPKAYSIAINGTVASCTNQASMPPGEIRCWIFAAAKDGAGSASAKASEAASARARAPRDESEMLIHERFSSRLGVVSLIR